MKQHGMLLSVLLAALLLLGAGCNNGNIMPTPTVRPTTPVNPTVNPTMNPTTNPTIGVSPSGEPDVTGGGADNSIEGFKEGETVEVSSLPDKVSQAVKDKYPEATIKSATYATYMDKQMYHLMLEGAGENTTEVYVQADGTLLPFNAQSTPESTGGGAGGGSTNNG